MCSNNRLIQKAGSRPRARLMFYTASLPLSRAITDVAEPLSPASIKSFVSQIESMLSSGTLEPFEEDLLRRLRTERPENLSDLVKMLVIGPTFEQRLDEEIRGLLDWDFPGILDGYLACMGALPLKIELVKDGNLESNSQRGALAIA